MRGFQAGYFYFCLINRKILKISSTSYSMPILYCARSKIILNGRGKRKTTPRSQKRSAPSIRLVRYGGTPFLYSIDLIAQTEEL